MSKADQLVPLFGEFNAGLHDAPRWVPPCPRPRLTGDESVAETPTARGDAWALPAPIGDTEMTTARLHPRCIVSDYLFADVATMIAPGGTGKTSATLNEAVCIVLGLPLWGLEVRAPGPVLIITAEDRREYLVARLREIGKAMGLNDEQMARVRQLVRIDDRTSSLRRLTAILADVVTVDGFAFEIVDACKAGAFAPVLAQFDPMVSFGVGEGRVNDAEQGLIEAARVITNGLDCCTRYIHHSGKAAALDKRTDQYAGRGGSALADGTRMVAVMQTMSDEELRRATGERLTDGDSAFRIERPKLSYSKPNQPPIYVRRRGYGFETLDAVQPVTPDERARAIGEQLARFLASELTEGRHHTRHSLELLKPESLSRPDVRTGLAWLTARGRLHDADVLDNAGKKPATGARTYLVAHGEARANR